MSQIRPFRGVRPRPDAAKEVASPPYDVLSSDEARALVKDNPNSFLRVNKPEVDFDAGADTYSDAVYLRGKENLARLISDGLMFKDDKPGLYLYRLTWQGRSQTGLVTLSSCAEYDAGLIKKHEHTRPVKVSDRADHIQTLGAQVGPVFSIYRHEDAIDALFKAATDRAPDYDYATPDDVRHEMWVVQDEAAINGLVDAFGGLEAIYIADGHHRSAAGSEVARRRAAENPDHTGEEHYNFFLNVIFSDAETRILPYNRAVKTLGGLSADDFLAKIADRFEVAEQDAPFQPERPHDYGMYLAGRWYSITCREGTYETVDPAESIDSAVLTANLLAPVLGIEDLRTDDRIDFIGGIRGLAELEKLVDQGTHEVTFSLYPASVAQLLAVADADQVMPPKSTWFEPKLRSGMVVNLLAE
ncbi:MAG: DUF1015 family protein [Planctomycetota bacterium]